MKELIWFSLDLIFTCDDTSVQLCRLSDPFPLNVLFSIQVDSLFNVKSFCGSTLINLYPVFSGSFLHQLTLFVQIIEVVSTVENSDVDFFSKLKVVSKTMLPLCGKTETCDETKKKIIFLCN